MPRSPIPSYLTAILDEVRPNTDGANADYIEGLRNADPDKLALAVCTRSGHLYSVGDDDYEFTIQSISKPFVYAVALDQLGEDKVHNHVGVEPSGEAFNELSLDDATHRPANPMINAGAIAVNRMVADDAAILTAFSRLAGRTLTVDESILQGELATADRNLALAHMLREYGMITGDVHDAVESYTRQCSILVTVRDLAVMAATLANGGLQPVTGERVLSTKACRLTQAVMASCGMYDGSGRWMSSVGIPAKSGVAGGLIGTLPGQLGAASLSPRLNSEGNSVRGVDIFQSMSSTLGLHMMASNYYSAPGIRAVHRKGETNIVELQGMINFTAAETILHDLVERELVGDNLVLDFRHVTSFNLAGRRLVKEGLRQFREDGFDVAVYDPAFAMPDYEFSDGTQVDSIQDVSESFELTVTPEEAYTALAEPEVDFDVAEDDTGDRLVWHSADEEWAESDIIFDFDKDSDGATTVHVTHRGLTPRYEEAAEHWRGEIRKRLKPLTQQD
ncbi:glutaminase [Corynebacterium tuscaniense]|uniref:Glutaminase n=1 Tax=Corynebacterium tuscaniense TaxID=302449 RepID=A0A2N6T6B0_9CORY|nr:glutaminase [Corynebacterium tuscaniense]